MKFHNVDRAEYLFKQMKKVDSSIYGIMMNGYKMNNQPFECLAIFEEAKKKKIPLDIHMALALVGACAQIGMRSNSRKVLSQISHLQNNFQLQNALIDMLVRNVHSFFSSYFRSSQGKSSDIQQAEKIFRSISQPNLITYTAMSNKKRISFSSVNHLLIFS